MILLDSIHTWRTLSNHSVYFKGHDKKKGSLSVRFYFKHVHCYNTVHSCTVIYDQLFMVGFFSRFISKKRTFLKLKINPYFALLIILFSYFFFFMFRRRANSNPDSPIDTNATETIHHVPSQNSQAGYLPTR